jgi:hypothetical protein
MNPEQIEAAITAGSALVLQVVNGIRGVIAAMNPEAGDAELDAIIEGVIANSRRRKALAEQDAEDARRAQQQG